VQGKKERGVGSLGWISSEEKKDHLEGSGRFILDFSNTSVVLSGGRKGKSLQKRKKPFNGGLKKKKICEKEGSVSPVESRSSNPGKVRKYPQGKEKGADHADRRGTEKKLGGKRRLYSRGGKAKGSYPGERGACVKYPYREKRSRGGSKAIRVITYQTLRN